MSRPQTVEGTTEHLLGLLPVHVLARDAATGGALRSLLTSVAAELSVLEADVEELYESWFVETCPEWVVPYLGDLVGVTDLPPDLGAGAAAAVSRRTVVANTVAYRRRKGTVAVVEQVVRDVTGWPTRVVEHYRLLATTAHQNHARLDRPATASLRDADRLDVHPPAVAHGALSPLSHTAEVRHIRSGRGRFGIANLGVFVFPVQVYSATAVSARQTTDGWTVHPMGWSTPLFAEPSREGIIEHLAEESDLPVPLRPRRLLGQLRRARAEAGEPLPLGIEVDSGTPLEPDRIRVCGLEELATEAGGDLLDGWQVMVDAVTGLTHPYLSGVPAEPETIRVSHSYGGSADVGAGTYPRAETHHDVLEADPFRGDVDGAGGAVRAQAQVLAEGSAFGSVTTIAEGLADAESAWADPGRGLVGGTYVVSIGDSATCPGDLTVHLPEATRLVLVAASWRGRVLPNGDVEAPIAGIYGPEGVRPHLAGNLTVTGAPGSSLVVDGLLIEGDLVVGEGALGSLAVSQSTVAGTVRALSDTVGPNRDLSVSVIRSIVAAVDEAPTVPAVLLRDSIVHPALAGLTSTGQAVHGEGLHLVVEGSTVRGDVVVRALDASSSVLDGTVEVEHRQIGCVRYSYVTPGSQVPRRFRCFPETETSGGGGPVYTSDEPGSPYYLGLAPSCPVEIAEGGEHGAEMGVHHHLRRPLRLHAARRLVSPYLPVGMKFAMFGS